MRTPVHEPPEPPASIHGCAVLNVGHVPTAVEAGGAIITRLEKPLS